MVSACGAADASLPDEILPIARSGRWPSFNKPQPLLLTVDQLEQRVWEFRAKVMSNIRKTEITVHSAEVWKASLKDVEEGSALGPFFAYEEVDRVVSCRDWIPTQRFEVIQKNKVRAGCDSATINGINLAPVHGLQCGGHSHVETEGLWAARRLGSR